MTTWNVGPGRVAEECGRRGITLDATITEVGSGLNGHRVKVRNLLADPMVTRIVVEHRDRLARFGSSTWKPRWQRADAA